MAYERIHIIEDEPAHAGLLDHALRKALFRTHVSSDGKTGVDDAKRLEPALILLDVMLPEMDGHEVCRQLREDSRIRAIPIIIVSALGKLDANRVAGLDLGVDDYIAKPFSPREVVARVKSVLRRSRPLQMDRERYLQGQLILEETFAVVSFRGRRLQLTGREWLVLRRLAQKPREVVSQEEFMDLLWGENDPIHERGLDRLVQSLRWKLDGEANDWGALVTVPSGGYLLALLPL